MANDFTIQQVKFDINFSSREKAFALQNAVSKFYNDRWHYVMQDFFEKRIPAEWRLRLENVQLDLGVVSYNNLEEDISQRLMAALEKTILKYIGESGALKSQVNKTDPHTIKTDVLSYFLVTGLLPWWSNILSLIEIEKLVQELIQARPMEFERMIRLAGRRKVVRHRLVNAVSDDTLRKITLLLEPTEGTFINEYHQHLVAAHSKHRQIQEEHSVVSKGLWEIIMAFLLEDHAGYYSRKEFTRSTLRNFASHFNVRFDVLLSLLISFAEVSPLGKDRIPLLHVLSELAEETHLLPGINGLHNFDMIRNSLPVNIQRENELPEMANLLLYYLLNGSVPSGYHQYTTSQLSNILKLLLKTYASTAKLVLSLVPKSVNLFQRVYSLTDEVTMPLVIRLYQPYNAPALVDVLRRVEQKKQMAGNEMSAFLLQAEAFDYIRKTPGLDAKQFEIYLHDLFHQQVLPDLPTVVVQESITEEELMRSFFSYDVLIYFLKYGVLPWWARNAKLVEMLRQTIALHPDRALALLATAGVDKVMQERLLLHFPQRELQDLFALLSSGDIGIQALNAVLDLAATIQIRSSARDIPLLYQMLWQTYKEVRYEYWNERLFFARSLTWLISKNAYGPFVPRLYLLAETIMHTNSNVLATFRQAIQYIREDVFEKIMRNVLTSVQHLLDALQYAFVIEVKLFRREIIALLPTIFSGFSAAEARLINEASTTAEIIVRLLDMVRQNDPAIFEELRKKLLNYPLLRRKITSLLLLYNQKQMIDQIEPDLHVSTVNIGFEESENLNTSIWTPEKWRVVLHDLSGNNTGLNEHLTTLLIYVLTWGVLPPNIAGSKFEEVIKQATLHLFRKDRRTLEHILSRASVLPFVRLQLYHFFSELQGGTDKAISIFLEQFIAGDKWLYTRTSTMDKSINLLELKTVAEISVDADLVKMVEDNDKVRAIFVSYLSDSTGQHEFDKLAHGSQKDVLLFAMQKLFSYSKQQLLSLLDAPSNDALAKMRLQQMIHASKNVYGDLLRLMNDHYEKDVLFWLMKEFGGLGQSFSSAEELLVQLIKAGKMEEAAKLLHVMATFDKFVYSASITTSLEDIETLLFTLYQKWGQVALDTIKSLNRFVLQLANLDQTYGKDLLAIKKFYIRWLGQQFNINDIKEFIRYFFQYAYQNVSAFARLRYTAASDLINQLFVNKAMRLMIRQEISTTQKNEATIPRGKNAEEMREAELYKQVAQQALREQQSQNEKWEKNIPEADLQKIYVKNAGLVLLHPFIPFYLRNLGLAGDTEFVDEDAKHRSALLLQFLVTGKNEIPEFELALNKILCDINFESVTPPLLEINEEELRLSEELFTVLFQRWDKMKNSSIEGFRASFLQREGMLTKTQQGWTLKVEQRGYDVLLETLPWSYRMIKFKWMAKPLYVEWA